MPFVAAIACGLVLLVVPLAASQLGGARAGDELVDLASPHLTKSAIARMRADLVTVQLSSEALRGKGFRRLATLSGESPDAFVAGLSRTDPAVSRGYVAMPQLEALGDKVITNLERRRGQFDSAKSLPGVGLSLRDGVWAGLALGAVLLVAGIAGLVRPRRSLAIALTAVGAALVVVPVAAGYPGKTADTDALLNSLRPFSIEKAKARQDAVVVARGFFDGTRHDVVPRVAARAGTTPRAVSVRLAAADPALRPAAFASTSAALDRFAALGVFSRRIQPVLVRSDKLPARTTTWLLIAPGILLALGGAAFLVRRPA